MRRLVLFSVILIIVIIGIISIVVFFEKDNSPQALRRSEKELLEAITNEYSDFISDSKPVIQIDSVSQHEEKWYVVTIKSLQPVENFVPVKVVLIDHNHNEDNGRLQVLLGPDIHFSVPQAMALNIPDSVIMELQKS